MKGNLFSTIRRSLTSAFFSFFALASTVRGDDDLLDAVLNAPSAAETTNIAPVVSASAEASGEPSSSAHSDTPTTTKASAISRMRSAGTRRAPRSLPRSASRQKPALTFKSPSGGKSTASGDHVETPVTFSLRGGAGSDGYVAAIEYRKPLGESPFDLSIRGVSAQVVDSGYNYYYSWYRSGWRLRSYRYSRKWELQQTDYGIESILIWTPYRRKVLEPFVGAGVRYETAKSKYSSYYSSYTQGEDSAACLVGRLGLKVNLGRLVLLGEYIFGGDVGDIDGTTELIGDIGFNLTHRMQIHLFAESLEMDVDSSTIFGGGLSFDF